MADIKVLALLVALFSACASGFNIDTRLIGSKDSSAEFYPYHVAITSRLFFFPENYIGSGALISPRWALTSATLAKRLNPLWNNCQVKAGLKLLEDTPVQSEKIIKIVIHEFFHGYQGDNDIALLKVSGQGFIINALVSIVNLPAPNFAVTGQVVVTGWQVANKDKKPLQALPLNVQNSDICRKALSDPSLIDETNLCLDTSSTLAVCSDDYGAPASAKTQNEGTVLVGIFTWTTNPCGKTPAVFTNVAKYTRWIGNNID